MSEQVVADAQPGAVPPWAVAYATFEGVHLVLHKVHEWFVCWGHADLLTHEDPHGGLFATDQGFGFGNDYEAALAYFRECEERLLEGRL